MPPVVSCTCLGQATFHVVSGNYSFTMQPRITTKNPRPAMTVLCAEGGGDAADTSSAVTIDCTTVLGPGALVSSIGFASYGLPVGSCGAYAFQQCHADNSRAVVEAACVGKSSCSFPVGDLWATFGQAGACQVANGFVDAASLRLAVQATCVAPVPDGAV